MYDLPTTISVGDKVLNIRQKADYRVIIDVIAALQDYELSNAERVISALMIFYGDIRTEDDFFKLENVEEAARNMFDFINVKNDNIGHKVNVKLIDWIQDEKLIVSAINKVAQTEIRALPYLHWWTFIAYYMAIGDGALATIVGIRDKKARHKKLEKYEREFVMQNPEYFVWQSERQENETLINEIWQKGG